MALIGDVAIGNVVTIMMIFNLQDSRRSPGSELSTPVPVLRIAACREQIATIKCSR